MGNYTNLEFCPLIEVKGLITTSSIFFFELSTKILVYKNSFDVICIASFSGIEAILFP